jgi:hypothetical protein
VSLGLVSLTNPVRDGLDSRLHVDWRIRRWDHDSPRGTELLDDHAIFRVSLDPLFDGHPLIGRRFTSRVMRHAEVVEIVVGTHA